MTKYIPLNAANWESAKAIGIDVTIAEETTDQTRRVRFFVPKSLLKDGAAPDWFVAKKARELKEEWAGSIRGGCFAIEGVTADGSAIFC